MTVHERQKPPEGHGEVLCAPPFETWRGLVERTAAAVATWPQEVRALREQARAETVAEAERFSATFGIAPARPWPGGPIAMTGHQPELYHPGVWVKGFLVDRLAAETGALGLDVVVDTDVCDPVRLRVPQPGKHPGVREIELTGAGNGAAYVQTAVPSRSRLSAFRAAGLEALGGVPAPALGRHFGAFCDCLDAAAGRSADLGTLMTVARRCYESPAETAYLEVQASSQCRLPSYRAFAGSLLADAARFRTVLNAALAEYRACTGTRSAAQPFPDLAGDGGRIEAPFWLLRDGRRLAVSVGADGTLVAGGEVVCALGGSAESAARALAGNDLLLAPRAVTLTLFQRVFVADLFVHGTGGGRYDQVTDAVIRSYYGVEPPSFAVASMTLLLPLGGRIVTDEDVAAAERELKRFEHNPDELLAEVEFDTPAERERADGLAARKAAAIAAIAQPDADRKALGAEIREVNAALTAMLEPVGQCLAEALVRAKEERAASAVLTDRTYPYCLWDPREVADKVR